MKLTIVKCKPNPTGKDKDKEKPLASQLLGETVDLKNEGDATISLSKCRLAHTKFDTNGDPEPKPAVYWQGASLQLKPGQTVRIHTGKSAEKDKMRSEDQLGVDYHSFSEKGTFVLNNKEGDKLYLYEEVTDGKLSLVDSASYDKEPPEGVTLTRVGAKLIPPTKGSTSGQPWSAPAVVGSSGKAA
jgi:hypothetical protein